MDREKGDTREQGQHTETANQRDMRADSQRRKWTNADVREREKVWEKNTRSQEHRQTTEQTGSVTSTERATTHRQAAGRPDRQGA